MLNSSWSYTLLLAASEKLYLLEEFQNLYMGWYLFIFAHNWYWFSSKFVLSITILFCYESPIMTDRYFASLQELWNCGLYCYWYFAMNRLQWQIDTSQVCRNYEMMDYIAIVLIPFLILSLDIRSWSSSNCLIVNAKTFQTRRELSMTSICGRK